MPREVALLVMLTDHELDDLRYLQRVYNAEWSEIIRTVINDRRVVLEKVLNDLEQVDVSRDPKPVNEVTPLANAEEQHIRRALEANGYVLAKTARALLIGVEALKKKMKFHGIVRRLAG